MENTYGGKVLPALAEIYPQLYLVPGDENTEAYKSVVRRGDIPEIKSLSHFITDERDSCVTENTPAGDITIVTLNTRRDFETFLNIMANKCRVKEIPVTQGASIIDGIINWKRIEAHRGKYFQSEIDCGRQPDWPSEFKRFTANKSNYLDAIIVLSTGPYSNIPAERFGFKDDEWLEYSYKIRKAHKVTHFICRRKYPELKDAIWDEVVADAVGIIAAFGRFDLVMEEVFLGVSEKGYMEGRLKNYVEPHNLDVTAKKVHHLLLKIEEIAAVCPSTHPFDFAVTLEEKKAEWWPSCTIEGVSL